MHIIKSQSLLFTLKAVFNVNTDLPLHGQTNGM